MKLLLDFLPVIAFFIAFRIGRSLPDGVAAWLGGLVDGQATAGAGDLLPVVFATAVAIVATAVQIAVLLARRHPVKPMVWISAILIVVFGGLTIWLHNAWFIKWKPTLLYWSFAVILLGGKLWRGRNLLGAILGGEIALPPAIWDRLLWAWCLFFIALGALNLVVAYRFSTDSWVNFKTFGLLGLTLVFSLATATVMARHVEQAPESGRPAPDA